ncbi:MAG TPA: isochorismatase family protein [Actinomycetota bacterium]|jgi:nicotinamidase/pyrazinamidase|nr:isochorismatase family protein [Actinomycetota bacterium]
MARYDPETVLLVVDVQNDFAHPDGSLYVGGGEEVVSFVNYEIEQALAAGALVVYTQDWHPEATPHFRKDGGVWPVHCVHDTWGAEFLRGLRVEGPVVRKGVDGKDGYSGFSVRDPRSGDVSATQLESLLRERGVERLVIAGIATDYCVVETTVDARRLGFPVTVLKDGIRAVDLEPGDGERATERMREAGAEVA